MAFKDLTVGALAYRAGVTNGGRLAEAIAIAQLESGFNPDAVGDTGLTNDTWGPSVGLWQIRSLKAESGKGTVRDETRLKDPEFNARSMASISKNGNDWSPWTTWTRVQKQALAVVYLPTAAAVVAAKGNPPGVEAIGAVVDGVVGAATGAGDALADISAAARATYNWISDRNNWFRVLKVVTGVALLAGGLYLVTRPVVTQAAEKIVSVAK